MLNARSIARMVPFCALLSAVLAAQPVVADSPAAIVAVAKHDKDNDKTLDLAEVKSAASAHFSKLDKDGDGTLDAKELKGLVGPTTLKNADLDKDGTLSKDEYMALVQKLFDQADVDHDGNLDAQELSSKAGVRLRHLID